MDELVPQNVHDEHVLYRKAAFVVALVPAVMYGLLVLASSF